MPGTFFLYGIRSPVMGAPISRQYTRRDLDRLQTRYDSHDQLKKLTVGNFDIGFAVLSSLITKMRDPQADLKAHGALIRSLLRGAWTAHRSMCRYLDTHDVDRVYVFNGRFATMRAVLRGSAARSSTARSLRGAAAPWLGCLRREVLDPSAGTRR